MPSQDIMLMIVRQATRSKVQKAVLRGDVSYLITGGTGGIGRAICTWMAQNGAKNIILASRSGKKQASAVEVAQELEALGTTIEVYACDVAIEADLQRLIEDCELTMPPIGGVIHGAYVNKVCASPAYFPCHHSFCGSHADLPRTSLSNFLPTPTGPLS